MQTDPVLQHCLDLFVDLQMRSRYRYIPKELTKFSLSRFRLQCPLLQIETKLVILQTMLNTEEQSEAAVVESLLVNPRLLIG